MSAFSKNIDSFTAVRILKKIIEEQEAKIQYGILSGKVDTLCLVATSLNVPFVTAMVPSIAKSKAINDEKQVAKKSESFIQIAILIGLPATIGMFIFAKPILNLLFPNASDGAMLLKINSISIVFMLIAQTINGILQGIGKIKVPVISFFIGMILKTFCNISLIQNPKIGIAGAAIGNIVCNIVVCTIGLIVVKKNINLKLSLKNLVLKPIIASSLMGIFSIYIYNVLKRIISSKMATILSIAVAVIIYAIVIILLKIPIIFDILKNKFKKNEYFF